MPLSAPFAVDQLVRVIPRKLEFLELPDVPYRVLEVFKAPPDPSPLAPKDALIVDTEHGPLVVRPDEAILVADAPAPALARDDDLIIGPGYVVTKAGGPITFAVLLIYEGHIIDSVPEPARTALRGLQQTLDRPGQRAAIHALRFALQKWQDAKKEK